MENAESKETIMNQCTEEMPMSFTHTRQIISPYLPPPVLRVMETINAAPRLKIIFGDEPAMAIGTIVLAMYVFGWLIKFIASSIGGKKAVEGLDDDAPDGSVLSNLDKKSSNDESYGDSIVLFGPSGGGKSVIFHSLLYPSSTEMSVTVTSLKANVAVLAQSDIATGDETIMSGMQNSVQIVDYPGHVALSIHLETLLYPKTQGNATTTRCVLVVDSTKPLTEAASLFYNTILTNVALLEKWDLAYKKEGAKLKIMVVCSKTDAPNSKNWRRVKIQLRTELEKLRKIASSVDSSTIGDDENHINLLTGKAIDLDDFGKNGLPFLQVAFQSLTCVGEKEGLDSLLAFITRGEILIDSSGILKNRKK